MASTLLFMIIVGSCHREIPVPRLQQISIEIKKNIKKITRGRIFLENDKRGFKIVKQTADPKRDHNNLYADGLRSGGFEIVVGNFKFINYTLDEMVFCRTQSKCFGFRTRITFQFRSSFGCSRVFILHNVTRCGYFLMGRGFTGVNPLAY